MKITFLPQYRDAGVLELHKNGDVLTVNGDTVDLTGLAEGQYIPNLYDETEGPREKVHPLIQSACRLDGEVCIEIILPYGDGATESVRFPEPLNSVENGVVPVPK